MKLSNLAYLGGMLATGIGAGMIHPGLAVMVVGVCVILLSVSYEIAKSHTKKDLLVSQFMDKKQKKEAKKWGKQN